MSLHVQGHVRHVVLRHVGGCCLERGPENIPDSLLARFGLGKAALLMLTPGDSSHESSI